MRTLKIVRQSFNAILANKGRSFLTILGIVIGIASVIALMSLGNGAQKEITHRVSLLGTANITVSPGARLQNQGAGQLRLARRGARVANSAETSALTQADLDSLEGEVGHSGIKAVSGNINGTEVFDTTSGQQLFQIRGTSASYFGMMNLTFAQGAGYTSQEVSAGSMSIALGQKMARDIFGTTDSAGKTLEVGGATYTVVGVLKPVDQNGFTDPNIEAYIPYTAAREAFSTQNFSSIVVQAKSDADVAQAENQVTKTLLASHGIANENLADFTVRSSQDLLSTVTSITNILTAFLAGIAAISLLVGGIGIMNIMLVSVTERTREIGLRKAVGARTGHILGQFLTESLLLTFTGGVLGIVFGLLLSLAAGRVLNFSTVVTGGSVLLAVCVAIAVGIVFGLYPAAKASRLNPIDALRYE